MNRSQFLFGVALILTAFGCGSSKKLAISTGSSLQYNVITAQKSLLLDVDVVESTNGWKFSYTVQNEDLSATISTPEKVLLAATELNHNFDGTDRVLTKSTSLRLSDTTFTQLQDGDTTEISYRIGFVKNTYAYSVIEKQKIKILINGKPRPVEVLYVEDVSDKGLAIWVWNNPVSPIIFRHNLGYDMVIREMKIP